MNHPESTLNSTISPTRRLNGKERAVFSRIITDFSHLTAADAEQLTMLAEATIRYENAQKETKKAPTLSTPVINRATGNIVGEKSVRNPAFATLKEAHSQMVALSRRLMVDAASAEKRQRLATKNARAIAAANQSSSSPDAAAFEGVMTEEEIEAERQEFPHLFAPAKAAV